MKPLEPNEYPQEVYVRGTKGQDEWEEDNDAAGTRVNVRAFKSPEDAATQDSVEHLAVYRLDRMVQVVNKTTVIEAD